MSTVIKVENLSKKYVLNHQRKERYRTLRDAIAKNVRTLGQRICSPFPFWSDTSGGGPTTEEFWALKDVSFEVNQGDRVGIIGRNGAGKSTLLKILSRITEPTQGRVSIKGKVASLLEVGTGFHPELTGRENIFLNGSILGMSRAEILVKLDEIVAFAEVEKFLDTPVKRYSSGMHVRLAFSIAAHLEPEILIVDEVLAVGDSQYQAKCIDKMNKVSSEGRTVLFVSHNMGVITNFCSKATLLNVGKVEAEGEPREIVYAYLALSQKIDNQESDLCCRYNWMSENTFTFEKIELFYNGQLATAVEMGSCLKIVLHYKMKTPTRFLKLGIHIVDSDGTLVCVLSPNQQWPDFVTALKPFGTLTCIVPCLNLIASTYTISLHCHIPGTDEAYILENVTTLKVLEKDVYCTGVIPTRVHGLTYFKADWSF